MGDTMPTVVAKGLIGVRLDRQYATAERRAESLMFLRRAWNPAAYAGTNAVVPTDGVDVAAKTKSLSDAERSLLNAQWFGPPVDFGDAPPSKWAGSDFNWWHRIVYPPPDSNGGLTPYYTVTEDEAKDGHKVLTLGLMRALEISFGLAPDEEVPATTGVLGDGEFDAKLQGKEPGESDDGAKDVTQGDPAEAVLDLSACRRNLPVDVYWVCGKLDGFEVEISWNQRQVTVFMLTPPIRFPAVLNLDASMALSTKARVRRAMQTDSRGVLLVGNAGGASQSGFLEWLLGEFLEPQVRVRPRVFDPDPTELLLALSDGGVTPS